MSEKLFGSYPQATLAFMAAGCGFIAVATLFLELMTSRVLAVALEMPIAFLSLPMGVATMILAGLTARTSWKHAAPALAFGAVYWVSFVAGLFI